MNVQYSMQTTPQQSKNDTLGTP